MIQLYKPNPKNTGSAFSFQLGQSKKDKEPCLYVNAIHQFSWNEKTRNGSFSENSKNPERTINVKFNEFEIGGFLRAIEKGVEYKTFHTFDDDKTSISFKPYDKADGTKAFSFSLIKNGSLKFGIGIELHEAYAIRAFLQFTLQSIYSHRQESRNQNA